MVLLPGRSVLLLLEVRRTLSVGYSVQQARQSRIRRSVPVTSEAKPQSPSLGLVEIDGARLGDFRRPEPVAFQVRLGLVDALEALFFQERPGLSHAGRHQTVQVSLAGRLERVQAVRAAQDDRLQVLWRARAPA